MLLLYQQQVKRKEKNPIIDDNDEFISLRSFTKRSQN